MVIHGGNSADIDGKDFRQFLQLMLRADAGRRSSPPHRALISQLSSCDFVDQCVMIGT